MVCVEGIIVVTATDVIVTWFKVLGSELLEAEESTVFWTVELDLDGELSSGERLTGTSRRLTRAAGRFTRTTGEAAL